MNDEKQIFTGNARPTEPAPAPQPQPAQRGRVTVYSDTGAGRTLERALAQLRDNRVLVVDYDDGASIELFNAQTWASARVEKPQE